MKNTKLLPILCALPVAGVLLWLLSGKNVANAATLALVLACPLSHVFLHGKHSHHKTHSNKG